MTDAPPPASKRSLTVRSKWVLPSIFLANAFEWFDLVVLGYFAPVFSKLFFPTESKIASLSLTFLTFGMTFLVRPLGAIALGSYSDRYGRKAALLVSVIMMTGGTAIIAVLPTYSVIGLFAPVILVAARILQGFSAGGEFGSLTTFLAEYDSKSRGFFASLQFSSQGFTALLATLFGVILAGSLSTAEIESFGWRIPFIFGTMIGLVAYLIRKVAIENLEFTSTSSPLKRLAFEGKIKSILSTTVVTLGTVVTYTIIFLPTYARVYLGFSATNSFLGGLVTSATLIIITPLAGAISDRLGRLKTMLPPTIIIILFSYPAFVWLIESPSLERLLIVQFVFGSLAAWYLGVLPSVMAELFPAQYRASGLAISYAVGVTVFGGFSPAIVTFLIQHTGNKLIPSFYLIIAAAISLIGLVASRRFGIK